MIFRNTLLKAISILFFSLVQPVYATATQDAVLQNDVLVHINEYRHRHGLAALKMDRNLITEAKQHSIDMATHRMPFGHKDFAKRIAHLHARINNSGAGAENVAYNYKDARTLVQQWVLSPGHKRNIVGNYNLTGIGVARDHQGKIYYTQVFLRTGEYQRHHSRRPIWSLLYK